MGLTTTLAKGAIKGPQPTHPNPGEYRDPTEITMPSLSGIAATADKTQAFVTTLPAVIVGVAYLYHKTAIEGSDRDWGAGGIIIVIAASYGLMSWGVSQRWGGGA